MAYLKAAGSSPPEASHIQETARPVGVVLGADTVVADGDEIIGQPRDQTDARRIIDQLAEAEHDVLTGVAMLCPATNRREIFVDRATVRVGRIEPRLVDEYLASGQWARKGRCLQRERRRIAAGWPITYNLPAMLERSWACRCIS